MDFNKLFIKSCAKTINTDELEESKKTEFKDIVKIDYDFVLFESSDKLKKELKNLIDGDKQAEKLKKDAVKNKDKVNDYLDHIYFMYEKDLEKISKKHKIDYDDIASAFVEL